MGLKSMDGSMPMRYRVHGQTVVVLYDLPTGTADSAVKKFARRHNLDDNADIAAIDEVTDPDVILEP